MNKLSISAISYLNTLPFVYGINYSGILKDFRFHLEIPSLSAKRFINNEVDIALIPVAALKQIESYQLLSEYCIGSHGEVKTVLLLSQLPLTKIKKIHLDYHSLTSVNLANVLAQNYWKITPEWIHITNEETYSEKESIVAIGDKTFQLKKNFNYVYDLSKEWYNFTRLPFVFACWVAKKSLSPEIIAQFTAALKWGVENKKDAITKLFNIHLFPNININEYLEKNIDYLFDEPKKKALNLFLSYLK
ncbi:MAG TPA: menaquinone biosynthesis protein [Bacteroidales bacterium]|nr:menaquinone biosynthesis protein [Bacteroidales bacterium]